MQTDYIIVGQGICGTLLSYRLLKEGKKILVIDEAVPFSSSKVAGGIINPVTGKRVNKSWMIDEFLPFAIDTYSALEDELQLPLIRQCDIIDFHPSREQQTIFTEAQKENDRLHTVAGEEWEAYFRFNYGTGKIAPCWLVDLQRLLPAWRDKLRKEEALHEERFNIRELIVKDQGIEYKRIKAGCILFCNGASGFNNGYFSRLPFSKNKGEVLIASIPGLPANNMYKQGIVKVAPWKEGLFWIGSSFDWNYDDVLPTAAFRKRVEEQLQYWLKLPYTVIDHLVAERPSTVGQMPFVGLHPVYPRVGILNGMGTKGCSMAPYFSNQLARHVLYGEAITPEADIKRFTRILSRDGTRTTDNG